MTIYKCPRCNFETGYITVYRNHLSRKNPCIARFSNEDPSDLLELFNEQKRKCHAFQCEYCNEVFSNSQRKYQHKKKCSAIENSIVTNLKKRIDDLTTLVQKQTPTVQNITIIQNQQNIENNIQHQQNVENQNITLSNFGSENLDYISDSFIRKCLKKLAGGFEDLTKQIHFNPAKPEYHNITTTNKKDPYLEVFKDGKWQYVDKNMTLDSLIKRCFDVLSSHYDEYEDDIRKEMSSFRFKQVDAFVESVLNQDKTIQTQLRKCLYLLILNHRDQVENTIK